MLEPSVQYSPMCRYQLPRPLPARKIRKRYCSERGLVSSLWVIETKRQGRMSAGYQKLIAFVSCWIKWMLNLHSMRHLHVRRHAIVARSNKPASEMCLFALIYFELTPWENVICETEWLIYKFARRMLEDLRSISVIMSEVLFSKINYGEKRREKLNILITKYVRRCIWIL